MQFGNLQRLGHHRGPRAACRGPGGQTRLFIERDEASEGSTPDAACDASHLQARLIWVPDAGRRTGWPGWAFLPSGHADPSPRHSPRTTG
jgi:hypothetical protein